MDEMLSTVGGNTYKPKIKKPPQDEAEETVKEEIPKEVISKKDTGKKKARISKKKSGEFKSIRVSKRTNDVFRMLCFFDGGNVQDRVNEILEKHIEENKDVYQKILKKNIKI